MRRQSPGISRGLVVLAVSLIALAAAAQPAPAGYGPFLGTWESVAAPGAPKVTMTWEDRGGGGVYIAVREGGTPPEAAPVEVIAFRQDGKDYPYGMRGGHVTSTIASMPVNLRAIDVTYKIAGTRVMRRRWEVSADGKTLTIGRPDDTTWTLTRHEPMSSSSEPRPLETGYKRYIGVWQAVQTAKGATTGTVVWEDRGDDFVVATVRDTAGRVTM